MGDSGFAYSLISSAKRVRVRSNGQRPGVTPARPGMWYGPEIWVGGSG